MRPVLPHPTTPKVSAPCLSLPELCENNPCGSSHHISSYTALVTHVQKLHNLVTICKGTSIILAAEDTYLGIFSHSFYHLHPG